MYHSATQLEDGLVTFKPKEIANSGPQLSKVLTRLPAFTSAVSEKQETRITLFWHVHQMTSELQMGLPQSQKYFLTLRNLFLFAGTSLDWTVAQEDIFTHMTNVLGVVTNYVSQGSVHDIIISVRIHVSFM